ncbi:MAG: hypothetical protein ABI042_19640 [Verrucomicrobiota bacterium]
MKPKNTLLEKLEQTLASHDNETKEQTIANLRAKGINTDALIAKVRATVQKGYSAKLKKIVEGEKSQISQKPNRFGNLATLTREAMLQLVEQLRSGAMGAGFQQAVVARCRNKQPTELTEDELRTWLEDLGELPDDSE